MSREFTGCQLRYSSHGSTWGLSLRSAVDTSGDRVFHLGVGGGETTRVFFGHPLGGFGKEQTDRLATVSITVR